MVGSKKYERWIRHSVATIEAHPRECWHQNISKNKVYIYPTLYRERERERGRERESDGSKRLIKSISFLSAFIHKFFWTPGLDRQSRWQRVLCTCFVHRIPLQPDTNQANSNDSVIHDTFWESRILHMYSLPSCGAVAFASCKQNWHPLWKIYEAKMQTTQQSISRETKPPSASKVTCLQVYAWARLEILPVKTVKRGEARQGALDSWSLFLRKK